MFQNVIRRALRFRLWQDSEDWRDTSQWLSTPGTVELVDVAQRKWGRGFHRRVVFTGELSYSYAANRTYYSGFCYRCFGNEREARQVVDRCRGKAIRVSYNPQNPEISFFAGFEDADPDPANTAPWLPAELFESYLRSLTSP